MTLHVNIYYCTYTYIIHKVYIIHTRTATATYLQRTIIRHQDIYRIYSWFSSPLFWMGWDCFFMFLLIFILYLFFVQIHGHEIQMRRPGQEQGIVRLHPLFFASPCGQSCIYHKPQYILYCLLTTLFFLDKIQSFYLVFLMNPSLPQSPYLSP